MTAHEATSADTTRRLQTMPGVGPITALAIETFAPPMEVSTAATNCARWRRKSVPVWLREKGREALVSWVVARIEARGA